MNSDEPIVKRNISEVVLERLLLLMKSGEFKPGDQMPSERELMARFTVGRPAVREALQSLQQMGLILIRHGERAKILNLTQDGIINQIDFAARQLLATSEQNVEFLKEARQILESGIAKLAVERATPELIQQLAGNLATMRRKINNRNQFLKADQAFHLTLAQMTGNPILLATMRAVFKWLSQHYIELLGVSGLEDLTLHEHEDIYKKVIDKDTEGAAKMVADHILRANERYSKSHSTVAGTVS
jgi:GntR family transcriptional regulator, sialic acid-inducible nan operon repressor